MKVQHEFYKDHGTSSNAAGLHGRVEITLGKHPEDKTHGGFVSVVLRDVQTGFCMSVRLRPADWEDLNNPQQPATVEK